MTRSRLQVPKSTDDDRSVDCRDCIHYPYQDPDARDGFICEEHRRRTGWQLFPYLSFISFHDVTSGNCEFFENYYGV